MSNQGNTPAAVAAFPVNQLTNAFVAFLFAASAPVAVILSDAKDSLTQLDISSWVFAAFAINGVLAIAMSVIYRHPLTFSWTIPGSLSAAAGKHGVAGWQDLSRLRLQTLDHGCRPGYGRAARTPWALSMLKRRLPVSVHGDDTHAAPLHQASFACLDEGQG